MWEPRRLTTCTNLRASTACYKGIFTYIFISFSDFEIGWMVTAVEEHYFRCFQLVSEREIKIYRTSSIWGYQASGCEEQGFWVVTLHSSEKADISGEIYAYIFKVEE
jgi:hypothetical protein